MDPLTNPALVLFSAISPLLIAIIKQQGFPTWANALIAFAAYVVVGVVGAYLSGARIDASTITEFIAVAGTIGTVAYKLLWTNLGEGSLTAATSIVRSPSL